MELSFTVVFITPVLPLLHWICASCFAELIPRNSFIEPLPFFRASVKVPGPHNTLSEVHSLPRLAVYSSFYVEVVLS